jgi:2-polyprenyl-3-methyl-5-hydroxy-6-metoxy-1,4-benzoquinol methylase
MISWGVFVSNSWERFAISSGENMGRLYRYNRDMHPDVAERLIDINREFYTRFGDSFSATRHRIQPGVRRVLESLRGEESILDLGCGNGELARELAKRGHRGPYLGVDFSLPLLRDAEQQPQGFSAKFLEADLTRLSANQFLMKSGPWDVITTFAVLHHIPSHEIRLSILRDIRALLAPNGRFILSNWQFLNSEKLKARIQPWKAAAVQGSDVEPGDYLLDWRNGGAGLRYVHHFSEAELSSLAQEAGFVIRESFYSDGTSGDLGLYQVWQTNLTH